MTTMICENKVNKILMKILTIMLAFLLIGTFTFASEGAAEEPEGGEQTQEETQEGGEVADYLDGLTSDSGVYAVICDIIGILSTAGVIIAIAKIMQIGMMFLIGSSVGKTRNEAKSALMPWVVGCLICATFGTLGPWVINLLMGGTSNDVFGI